MLVDQLFLAKRLLEKARVANFGQLAGVKYKIFFFLCECPIVYPDLDKLHYLIKMKHLRVHLIAYVKPLWEMSQCYKIIQLCK